MIEHLIPILRLLGDIASRADEWLRPVSIPAWLICLLCLSPAILRLLRGRGRYLDPIWAIVFLLAINRVLYLSHLSPELSRGSAIVLALTMGGFSLWYQHHDA